MGFLTPIVTRFGHALLRDPKWWGIRSIFPELYTIRAFQNCPRGRPVTNWDGPLTLVNIASFRLPKKAIIGSARGMHISNKEAHAGCDCILINNSTNATHSREGFAGSHFLREWDGLKVA